MSQKITGYVLAGGESSRMQHAELPRDKALIEFAGETLLARALRKVSEVCGDAVILGGPPERCARLAGHGRVVPDAAAGVGPLAGLAAALSDLTGDWAIVVPVDVPLLSAEDLHVLVAAATIRDEPAVAIYQTNDQPQPLPVVLHRSARTALTEAVLRNEHKLLPVLWQVAAGCTGGMQVLQLHDRDDCARFHNANTPEDLLELNIIAGFSNQSMRGASE